MGEDVRSTALPRFLLYAALYAAFGVASPFLPALVSARGLPAAQLGLVLSAGTAIRLLTAPLAGRLGDVLQGLRGVLVVCLVLAAVVTLGYLPAQGFWPFLALSLGHAAALAPVTILADALALGAAVPLPAAAAAGSSTAGCAGRAQRPSSVAHCCRAGGERLGPRRDRRGQALLLGAAAVAALRVPSCGMPAPWKPCARKLVVRRLLRLPPFASSCWWPPSSWGATPCTTPLRSAGARPASARRR